jgi:hypothetical protein
VLQQTATEFAPSEDRLRELDTSTHAWVVEPGTYDVLVGASVDAVHCAATAEMPGGAGS